MYMAQPGSVNEGTLGALMRQPGSVNEGSLGVLMRQPGSFSDGSLGILMPQPTARADGILGAIVPTPRRRRRRGLHGLGAPSLSPTIYQGPSPAQIAAQQGANAAAAAAASAAAAAAARAKPTARQLFITRCQSRCTSARPAGPLRDACRQYCTTGMAFARGVGSLGALPNAHAMRKAVLHGLGEFTMPKWGWVAGGVVLLGAVAILAKRR